ncbi:hypothetical protein JYG53_13105, partial [Escherichia fergusonii]|uniref:hypothetical protein n=1 Tax=Escherichia fergusonii TaxID=564 RepID=UPI001CBF88F8
QIKQKAIRQDGIFALVQKKVGCDAGCILSVLRSHISQIQQRIRLPQIAHFHTSSLPEIYP